MNSRRWAAAAAAAVVTGQVLRGEDVGKARLHQQCAHGLALIVAVFEQQPAVGGQPCRGAGDDGAQVAQAVVVIGEGAGGVEAQVALAEVFVDHDALICPTIGGYAEYDAIPGRSQAAHPAGTNRRPRRELGFTRSSKGCPAGTLSATLTFMRALPICVNE